MGSLNVEDLAQSILDKTFIDDWYFYLILFCLSLLGAFFGAFLRGYGKEKAKYSAIESSLETIRKQVSETTKVSEEIKRDIELQVWRAKERQALRREKLEAYITTIYLVRDNNHLKMQNSLLKGNRSFDEAAWNKANMLQKLYFPELSTEHNQFRKAQVAFEQWLAEAMKANLSQMEQGNAFPMPDEEHMRLYSEIQQNFNPALLAIDEKAEKIASELIT